MRRWRLFGALVVVGCGLVVVGLAVAGQLSGGSLPVPGSPAAPAGAASAGDKVPPSAPAGPSPSAPSGYVRVVSGAISSPDGTQVSGQATCPSGTVVWGGGVFVSSSSTNASVNSSYPLPTKRGWKAWVNNTSGAATDFTVTAVCAAQPLGYKIVAKTVPTTPVWNDTATANCPAGAAALSGGGLASSRDLSTNLNSSHPTFGDLYGRSAGWQTDLNSYYSSGSAAKLTTYVICAKPAPAGYTSSGATVTVAAGAQTNPGDSTTSCPAGVATGAAAWSGAKEGNLNTLTVGSSFAQLYANNGSTHDEDTFIYVTCVS